MSALSGPAVTSGPINAARNSGLKPRAARAE
jgi:hypothetical protein